MDINTAIINTIVDLDNIMADSQGKLVFNFYVEVTAVDVRVYILNVNDLLAAVQVSLTLLPYSIRMSPENTHNLKGFYMEGLTLYRP